MHYSGSVLKHGFGKESSEDYLYEGEWYLGVKQGQGRMRFADGSVYEGSWNKGLFHGHGTLKLTNHPG